MMENGAVTEVTIARQCISKQKKKKSLLSQPLLATVAMNARDFVLINFSS